MMLIKGLNNSSTEIKYDLDEQVSFFDSNSRPTSATTAAATVTRPQSAVTKMNPIQSHEIKNENHKSNLRPQSARIYTPPSLGLGIGVSINLNTQS